MDALLATVAIAFVLLVLMVLAYALFEMSPFASHKDRFRDPGGRQKSPRLD
jgi:Na+-transporting methylmalonyl-CoA/oxaloacetate decarboxylase gamma subunit